MANHKSPIKFDMKNVVFVKPSKPIHSSILSLSTVDNRPDLDSISKVVCVYQSTNNHDFIVDQLDPTFVIKEALSKALLYYYPFAGRLVKYNDGNYRIHFNADYGVPFMEAFADCHLSSLHYMDGNDMEFAKYLVCDLPLEDKNGHQYPLMFKVTKFLCGGFAIGLGLSHRICDGFGGAKFIKAIAELARGNCEPFVKPVWERERLIGSITTKQPFQVLLDMASAAISPFGPNTTLMHECFKVDYDSIRRLKMKLLKENDNETMEHNFTTFEALGACVWRSRARALELNNKGKTILSITMGMRGYLDPPLPEGYYGNAIMDAYLALTVRELNEIPLSKIAKLIRETKKAKNTVDCVKNSINTSYPSLNYFNNFCHAFTSLVDWTHLGLMEKIDFGGNKLVNMIPVPCEESGSLYECIFTPPAKLDTSMKGGVKIFLSLPSAAMLKFREEMEVLGIIKPVLCNRLVGQ
ncbi:unnamed protein product [Lupinus luteus]|uniref:Uncharacterized protein n=1 Tax=Lupinus luteus TaxID=3873 RepID=A0AAV1WME3_LUPLU